MAEKPGYWDVEKGAWVGAAPTNVLPGLPAPPAADIASSAGDTAVPEQRPAAEPAMTVDAPD